MKKWLSLFTVLVTFFCFQSTAFMAWSPNYEEEPDMLNPHHILGAFAWHDNDGFHLRTTTAGKNHVFTGIIHTNGYFGNVNDRFFRGSDFYRLRDRDTIEFQFTTDGRTVGLDFDATDGDYLAFELYMDGHRISPLDIYVGKNGWHPGDYKFTLDRPPYYDHEHSVVIVHGGWYGHWGRPWWHHW